MSAHMSRTCPYTQDDDGRRALLGWLAQLGEANSVMGGRNFHDPEWNHSKHRSSPDGLMLNALGVCLLLCDPFLATHDKARKVPDRANSTKLLGPRAHHLSGACRRRNADGYGGDLRDRPSGLRRGSER